jgi:hypothetical protein
VGGSGESGCVWWGLPRDIGFGQTPVVGVKKYPDKLKYFEDTVHTLLNFQSSLPVPVDIVLY